MAVVAAGKVVTALLGLATFALLTRHLGPSGFGSFRIVPIYLGSAVIFANLGLDVIVLREISRVGADQSRILGNAVAMRFGALVAVLASATGLAFLLPYDAVVKRGILIGSLAFVGISGNHLLVGVFQEKLKQWQSAFAEILGAAAMLGLVGIVVWTGGGVIASVWSMVVSSLISFALAWRFAGRLIPFRMRLEPEVWKTLGAAGLPLAGSQILTLIYFHLDTLLLSLLKPPADVGLYGVARKFLEIVITLALAFAGLTMPFLARHASSGKAFGRTLASALDVTAIGSIGALILCLRFADEIAVFVGGPEFLAAGAAIRILSLAMPVVATGTLLRIAVAALDRQRAMLRADCVAVVVGLTAYLVLIPRFSYIGAAWGTLVTESLVFACALAITGRAAGGFPPLTRVVRATVAGALGYAAFGFMEQANLHWIANALAGSLLYIVLLLLLGALPRDALSGLPGSDADTESGGPPAV